MLSRAKEQNHYCARTVTALQTVVTCAAVAHWVGQKWDIGRGLAHLRRWCQLL